MDLTGSQPSILRPGVISVAEISAVLGVSVSSVINRNETKTDLPRVSGSLDSHYALRPCQMLLSTNEMDLFLQGKYVQSGDRFSCYRHAGAPSLPEKSSITQVSLSADAKAYAHDLYALLRALDHQAFKMSILSACQTPLTGKLCVIGCSGQQDSEPIENVFFSQNCRFNHLTPHGQMIGTFPTVPI